MSKNILYTVRNMQDHQSSWSVFFFIPIGVMDVRSLQISFWQFKVELYKTFISSEAQMFFIKNLKRKPIF